MTYWKDKTVVVTGGSNGLGRELALNFARNQAFVFVLARNEARLKLMAEEALLEGLQIGWRVADVTDDQSVQDAVTGIIRRRGAIDVWINNVGKSTRVALTECGVEEYKKQMEVNFYSSVRCSLAALPHLAETGGQLVNIGSLTCKTGWPYVAP